MRVSNRSALIACIVVAAAGLPAQTTTRSNGAYATRAELESTATRYAREGSDPARSVSERAQSVEDEKQVKERLRVGDFRVGDRIILRLSGGAVLVDTVSVSPARTLRLPEAGEVSVQGLLRSELQQYLDTQLARFIRNTVVTTEPLTRLAVLGEVRSPGFVHVPSRSLLSDVISAAGGPTATGMLDRAIIRRSGRTVLSSDAFARALASGATLDDIDVQAGDEVVLEPKRSFNWAQFAQTTAIVLGSAATLVAIQHR